MTCVDRVSSELRIPSKVTKNLSFDKTAVLSYLLLIALAVMVIFSNGQNQFTYEGDDFLQTVFYPLHPWMEYLKNYAHFASLRHFLAVSYRTLYEWCHANLYCASLVLNGVFVLSALIFLTFLRRHFSAPASLIAAIFYLVYCGKYHAIVAYNAQLHCAVMLLLFLMLLIADLTIRPCWKASLMTLIFWFSLHWYEVLLILLPISPVYWCLWSWMQKKTISWREWAYAMMPWGVAFLHLWVLNTNPEGTPIWTRSFSLPSYIAVPWPQKIWKCFINGLNDSVGFNHIHLLQDCIFRFLTVDLSEKSSLWLGLVLFILGLFWVFNLVRLQQSKEEGLKNGLLILGAYLFVVSPLLSIPLELDFIPSRLLILPSVGLSLMMAALMDRFLGKLRWMLTGLVLLICLAEGIALCDILQQYQTAFAYDQSLLSRLYDLVPRLEPNTHLWLSLPRNPKNSSCYWQKGFSLFEAGPQVLPLLWKQYGLSLNTLDYRVSLRDISHPSSASDLAKWLSDNQNLPAQDLLAVEVLNSGEIVIIKPERLYQGHHLAVIPTAAEEFLNQYPDKPVRQMFIAETGPVSHSIFRVK